jgi:hypothetical protein
MLMPVYDAVRQRVGCKALLMDGVAQHEARINPFSAIDVCPMTFADGMVLGCECSNPGCNRNQAAADLFTAEMRIPEQPHRTCAEVLGGCEPLCRCAQAALNAKFGATGTMEHPKEGFCAWYQEQDPFSASHLLHGFSLWLSVIKPHCAFCCLMLV